MVTCYLGGERCSRDGGQRRSENLPGWHHLPPLWQVISLIMFCVISLVFPVTHFISLIWSPPGSRNTRRILWRGRRSSSPRLPSSPASSRCSPTTSTLAETPSLLGSRLRWAEINLMKSVCNDCIPGRRDQVRHPALCSQQGVHLLGHLHFTAGILLKKWNSLKFWKGFASRRCDFVTI